MESHGQSESETQPLERPPKSGRARHRFRLGAIILLYLLAAYVLIPLAWKWQVRRHPELFDAPRVTHTPNGIPGDPINVAILGSEADVIHAMVAAKWDPADPFTFRSSVRIAVDSVFRQPDTNAPVSTLELFGRKQDFAFERPVGDSPRQRHHIRFWHWGKLYNGKETAPVIESRGWQCDRNAEAQGHFQGVVVSFV